jgi:signal peptidase II
VPRRVPLRKAAAGTIIAILAVLVLAADQFAKVAAIANLPLERPVPVIGEFLQFYLTYNPGAAFSLGEGVTWIFTIALAAVAVAIIWIAATRLRSRAWAIILGLLLGGVLGNLTDRLFREPGFAVGHVVDYIYTPWMMPAIYNIADMFIVTMMIAVAITVLVGLRFDGTREPRETRDTADAATTDDAESAGDAASTDPASTDPASADPASPDSGATGR